MSWCCIKGQRARAGPVAAMSSSPIRRRRSARGIRRLTGGADLGEGRAPDDATSSRRQARRHRFGWRQYFICLRGIVWREALRFIHQRERFVSALVRPLVWLFIFAAGFRQVLGVSIIPPYETYVLYEVYIAPGLIAMIQLFNGMQSSLSMVYDREMGHAHAAGQPAAALVSADSKLLAGTLVSVLQVYAFLLIAWFWEIEPPHLGYLTVLPALLLSPA
jgi:ABC-2 type transport system permease protein